jgi:hypothetical protein
MSFSRFSRIPTYGQQSPALHPPSKLTITGTEQRRWEFHIRARVPSALLDRVPMPLPKQANHITRSIDNRCKPACDVSTQHADVKRFQVGDSRILTSKQNFASRLTTESNVGFYNNRISYTSHAAETIQGNNRLETKDRQNSCTEHGAIGARLH